MCVAFSGLKNWSGTNLAPTSDIDVKDVSQGGRSWC